MKRMKAVSGRILPLCLALLMLVSSAAAEGVFPSINQLFGTAMPSVGAALGRSAGTAGENENGKYETYSDFSYDDYTAFGAYLAGASAVLENTDVTESAVTVTLSVRGASMQFIYDWNARTATAVYPSGTRPETEKETAEEKASILPEPDNIGKPMPSLGEALGRYPDEEIAWQNGGSTEVFQGVTETEFNAFSVYLSEQSAVLEDYETVGSSFFASVQVDGKTVAFTYDIQTKEAKVTYPRGTYDKWLYDAKRQSGSELQLTGAAETVKAVEEKVKEVTEAVRKKAEEAVEEAAETVEEKAEEAAEAAAEVAEAAAEEVKVMTHEEFMAAEEDSEVVIESCVQAHQSWWDNKVTVYLQSEDGAYFAYEMACSEEDAAKLVPGTKIRVKGYKTAWAGEVEIASGCTFEFVEAEPWEAEAADVTALLDTEELIGHMNEKIAVKGATVVAQKDAEGNDTEAAFSYKNPEEKTDDLYFSVDVDGQIYDFCVEYYLCGKDTDVYKAVENLKIGDVINVEGFLYWYNGMNPHTTKVEAAQ